MGADISSMMSGIHMKRMQKDRVASLNPKFYRRNIDNTITKRKKNTTNDELLSNMNSHHENIESNPARFFDTASNVNLDAFVTIKVFQKPGKFPAIWNSEIPKSQKKKNINGDLHWTFKHASDFDAEVSIITKKYLDIGYPIGFITSVISDFKNKGGNQPVIPDKLFEERSKVLFKLRYCPRNEYEVKRYTDKIESYTGGNIRVIVLWSS